jgi:trehalose/maltose transport system permease protein
MLLTATKNTLFYLLVAVIVVIAVFPFYYAILTSFKASWLPPLCCSP